MIPTKYLVAGVVVLCALLIMNTAPVWGVDVSFYALDFYNASPINYNVTLTNGTATYNWYNQTKNSSIQDVGQSTYTLTVSSPQHVDRSLTKVVGASGLENFTVSLFEAEVIVNSTNVVSNAEVDNYILETNDIQHNFTFGTTSFESTDTDSYGFKFYARKNGTIKYIYSWSNAADDPDEFVTRIRLMTEGGTTIATATSRADITGGASKFTTAALSFNITEGTVYRLEADRNLAPPNDDYQKHDVQSMTAFDYGGVEVLSGSKNGADWVDYYNIYQITVEYETSGDDNGLGVPSGSSSFTWKKLGYYPQTVSVNAIAGVSNDVNLSVYDHKLTINLYDLGTGSYVTGVNFSIYSNTYDYVDHGVSSGNTYIANITDGSFTVYANTTGFAIYSEGITLSSSQNATSLTMLGFGIDSVLFYFFDEISQSLLTNVTITAYLTGTITSYNFTTDNGSKYYSLIEPQNYTVTYYADGYSQREYYFTLLPNGYESISLYMINSSLDDLVTVTVRDSVLNVVEGTEVIVQRKNLSGTNYYQVEACKTDSTGVCLLHLVLYDTTYRFIVLDSDGSILKTTEDQKVISDSIIIVVPAVRDNLDDIDSIQAASGVVSYNNNTQTFSFSWANTGGVNAEFCLEVKKTRLGTTSSVGTECSSSTSGTMTRVINESLADQFVGTGYLVYENEGLTYNYPLDKYTLVTSSFSESFGILGLFIFGFIVAGTAGFLGLFSPVVAPTLMVFAILIAGWVGIISIGTTAAGAISAALVLVIFLVKR